MKPVEVIEYDEQGLKTLAARVNAFAVSEDLPAHGECVLSRFIDDPYNKATIKEQEEQAGHRGARLPAMRCRHICRCATT